MTDELYSIIVASIIIIVASIIIAIVMSIAIIVINTPVEEERREKISDGCSHIFNPSTSVSNYTSYQHCIKYPETYGVGK